MLVDDDAFSRRLIGHYLNTLKPAHLDVCAGGEEALERVVTHRPDLIVMDCQMPGLDGFDTTRRLRADGFAAPILALSADDDERTVARCQEAGMTSHLRKPITAEVLRSAVHQALGLAVQEVVAPTTPAPTPQTAPASSAPPSAPPEAPAAHDPLDRVRKLAAAAGNPGLAAKLVASFIGATDATMDALVAACQAADAEAAVACTHKLRGAAGSFGATALASQATRAEEAVQQGEFSAALALTTEWPAFKERLTLDSQGG